MAYDFTHMWNLQNKTNKEKRERQTIKQSLKYREQTEGCWMGDDWGGWVKWVMGIKEDTCDEHWCCMEVLNP